MVYEQYNTYYRVLDRLQTEHSNCCYSALKFYSNGLLNLFILKKEGRVTGRELDPEYNGFRGNYYTEDGRIKMDLFVPTDELRHINKRTETLLIKDDTLYVNNRDGMRKYVKSKFIPQDSLRYKANW
ncbi:MAG: hypothetical protein EOO45_02545 [Flavobacterium sp.]|nr:MAG: hypothetical protein EOO45_02545 [Flavobacterium sp.]